MALTLLAANNAQTVLAAGISASATTMTVNSGTGALFPSPSAGVSFFKLTLVDAATGQLTEIVHVTARTGDTMTIDRGQEGTTARAWSANDIAVNMMTAGTLSYILTNFQPLDATLTALAGLATGANKLPYFNGTDTAAQTDLTSVGRDIIGMSSIANVLSYLGVSYTISEPDTETVVYTLPGGYKLMAFNRLVNNSTTVGTGVTTPITFPQAFPSRLIAVFATKKNYVQAAVSCENQSLTGFDAVVTLITTIASGITSTRAMFLAIGK
ncbi:hypothetical protein [Enterobacter asburiae]|uniref:hypothetical protein n=1 Tax=Enterobacter asburiae TaxID=61645 RepID=UPI001D035191|nr:hypothetical protein [Enterobacter asburiae]